MTRTKNKTGSRAARNDGAMDSFDDEGVRLAILAALEAVYECFPHIPCPSI